jgi:hypothetical protein
MEEGMAKYKVLSVIEYNETLYWPEPPVGAPEPPKTSPSFGHGRPAPVVASGVIELSEDDAKPLLVGKAIEPMKEVKKEAKSKKQEE